jgi:cysteine desulfurase family protein (TIGR01976 family)
MPSPVELFERILPWIRAQFPSIESVRSGRRRIYLDNAAGTLVPRSVAEALTEAALWSNPQPGRPWPPGPETRAEHQRMRRMLGDFLNAGAGDRIYLSESTTASLFKLREALEPGWSGGDHLVVTDCDHFANISPWEWRAERTGIVPRRVRMQPDGSLDQEHLAEVLGERTRVVALALAGNGLGSVLDLEAAIRQVRERSPDAVVVVDGVHAAPHVPIDVVQLGADALAFSTYKLFGPLCGVLWVSEGLAERLDPFHVEPHTEPETVMEWGTLNSVTVAGIGAALEYLQRVGEKLEPAFVGSMAGYPRERRLYKLVVSTFREYEAELSRRVLRGFAEIEGLELLGIREEERVRERVPTFAFAVRSMEDAEVVRRLWDGIGVQVAAGDHYSAAVRRGLGRTSVVRASFAHYNTAEEADALVLGLKH